MSAHWYSITSSILLNKQEICPDFDWYFYLEFVLYSADLWNITFEQLLLGGEYVARYNTAIRGVNIQSLKIANELKN